MVGVVLAVLGLAVQVPMIAIGFLASILDRKPSNAPYVFYAIGLIIFALNYELTSSPSWTPSDEGAELIFIGNYLSYVFIVSGLAMQIVFHFWNKRGFESSNHAQYHWIELGYQMLTILLAALFCSVPAFFIDWITIEYSIIILLSLVMLAGILAISLFIFRVMSGRTLRDRHGRRLGQEMVEPEADTGQFLEELEADLSRPTAPPHAKMNEQGQLVWVDDAGTVYAQNPDGSMVTFNVRTGMWARIVSAKVVTDYPGRTDFHQIQMDSPRPAPKPAQVTERAPTMGSCENQPCRNDYDCFECYCCWYDCDCEEDDGQQ
jgi:hypothetical protein